MRAEQLQTKLRSAVLGAAGLAAAGLLIAGCGSSSTSGGGTTSPSTQSGTSAAAASSSAATVKTGTVAGLGAVLENGQGRVLYIYTPDGKSGVTCTGSCASTWPPLQLTSGQTPMASGATQTSLLGSISNPAGGKVATYGGRPLYTYSGDSSAGTANGQGTGGIWYVVSPSGAVITSTSGSSGASSPSGY